jgi:hypothetical protein
MRRSLAACGGLLLAAGLAAPAQAQASSTSIGGVFWTVRDILDDGGVDPPVHRMYVTSQITITRTALGSTVVHDFPSTDWDCVQPANPLANPFTVTCTAIQDVWECVAMPVEAHSLAPDWTVTGTVGCTNSISAGPTTWPSPAVSASTSLGYAPTVTCTADGGFLESPVLAALRDALGPILSPPQLDSPVLHQVTCGPDPYVP